MNASDDFDQPWKSAIFKEPVNALVWLGTENLAGDRQADLNNHGGPHRAVLAYAASHYPAWQEELAISQLPYGGFGENFTVGGQTEHTVCIGDTYEIGGAVVQVSQPRSPCWKLQRRWRLKGLLKKVVNTGRQGWYLRVLQEGKVEAGLPVNLIERPYPNWNVAYISHLLRHPKDDLSVKRALLAREELSPGWRESFAQHVIRWG